MPETGFRELTLKKARLRLKTRKDYWLTRSFYFSMRHAWWVIIASFLGAGGALYYTATHLKINTYPGNVLSDSLPWRQDKLNYEKAFPQFRDSIVAVIDAPTVDQARESGRQLYSKLLQDHQHYDWVFYPPAERFFRQNGLLFSEETELEKLSYHLAKVQPFLAEVSTDPSLRGMFHLLALAVERDHEGDLDLKEIFDRIHQTLDQGLTGTATPLSWAELMSGSSPDPRDRQVLMEIMPNIEYSSLAPGEEMMQSIRKAGESLGFKDSHILLRLSGAAALSVDELKSASVGAQMASLGSFLGVSLVMLIGLRSLWLVLIVQIGLILGLIFTAAFATLALGQLNLISVAFSVMYIGIGADYAIYLCLRYRELSETQSDHKSALKQAVRHVGGSLEIGTITTAIGFFCFIPTSYRGVAELGIISGGGMFISLFVTLLILPAFLSIRRPAPFKGKRLPAAKTTRFRALTHYLLALPVRHSRTVLLIAGCLGVVAATGLGFSHFDKNPLNLQDPTAESVSTFRELLKDSRHSPWSLVALTRNPEESEALRARLEQLPEVSKVLSLSDFIPKGQASKLETIEEMSLTLGPSLGNGTLKPQAGVRENLSAIREFQAQLSRSIADHPDRADTQEALRLLQSLAKTLEHLESLEDEAQAQAIDRLAHLLIGTLPAQLMQLRAALDAQPFQIEDLPVDIRERWISSKGDYRIEIQPKEDLHSPEAMERFVRKVKEIAPHATGVPVLFIESSNAVVKAFLEAFSYALIAITLILYFTMHQKLDVILVLAPLLLASLLTGALMSLAGVPFNFANIIALPLVFGMGVDNCIHMVHRYRTAPPKDGILLQTSTALAVVLSALTNVSGFGNLSVSPHQGMASMGMMLTIGILSTLLCSMIVLPALLAWMEARNTPQKVKA